jgi:hypothetical protein
VLQKAHSQERLCYKKRSPEGRARGGKAVRVSLRSLNGMLGEWAGYATSRPTA